MEWTTVTVIIALVGLIAAVAGPLIKLNTIITRLAVIVDELGKQMNGFVDKNSEAHGRLWDKLGEHDEQLSDHDKRLTVIEKEHEK